MYGNTLVVISDFDCQPKRTQAGIADSGFMTDAGNGINPKSRIQNPKSEII